MIASDDMLNPIAIEKELMFLSNHFNYVAVENGEFIDGESDINNLRIKEGV